MSAANTVEFWKKVRVFPAWLVVAEALLLVATFLLPIIVRTTDPLAQLVFQLAFMIMLTLFMATLTTWMVAWSIARALTLLKPSTNTTEIKEKIEGTEKKEKKGGSKS